MHQINFENKQNIKSLMKPILKNTLLIFAFLKTLYNNVKRKWKRGIFLGTSCFFCIVFKYSKGISKFTAPGPLCQYTFLHRIKTFGRKKLLLKIDFKKSKEREKLTLRKQL